MLFTRIYILNRLITWLVLVAGLTILSSCKTTKNAQKNAKAIENAPPKPMSNGLLPPQGANKTINIPVERYPIGVADTTIKNNYQPKDLNALTEADLGQYYKNCLLFARGFQYPNIDKLCQCLGNESIANVQELQEALYHCANKSK